MIGDVQNLRARFARAVVAAGAARASDAVFAQLVTRYGEHHRHYHTLTHVNACLMWLDRFPSVAEHPQEVELALWFHDAVYDPRSSDNERLSAQLARDALNSLGVVQASIDRITRYIEATESHTAMTGDATLVIDLDLAILGSSSPDFNRFEMQIRKEYAHVPDPLYRAGRCRVLQGFLARSLIYQEPRIGEVLEAPARRNLERRVRELSL